MKCCLFRRSPAEKASTLPNRTWRYETSRHNRSLQAHFLVSFCFAAAFVISLSKPAFSRFLFPNRSVSLANVVARFTPDHPSAARISRQRSRRIAMTGRLLVAFFLLVGVAAAQMDRSPVETVGRVRVRIVFPDQAP